MHDLKAISGLLLGEWIELGGTDSAGTLGGSSRRMWLKVEEVR